MKNQKARGVLERIVGVSLIGSPLILMLGFALHYSSLAEFFVFELRYIPTPAREFMNTLSSANSARLYTIPHGVAYLAVPFFLVSALYLAYMLRNRRPWVAISGAVISVIGTISLSGVFAAWLSFAAVGNVAAEQIEGAIPALDALTEMQGPLLIVTALSALSMVGMLVLAAGLYSSQIVSRWSASLIFMGNLLILVFTDLDNWMFIGAFLMLLGVIPISLPLLASKDPEEVEKSELKLTTT